MLTIIATTISEFQKNIGQFFDRVVNNSETLTIDLERCSGVVVMSLAEYDSLAASEYELSSTVNAARLDSAISNLEQDRGLNNASLKNKIRYSLF